MSYLNADETLHTLGRLITRSTSLRVLTNRLMIINEFSKDSAILQQQIKSPIFITGNPRSGTSILFELLSQGKMLRHPVTWEAICPAGPPANLDVKDDVAFKIELTKAVNDIFMEIYPAFRAVHELRWDLPVECLQIMDLNFAQLLNGKNDDYRWMERMDKKTMYSWKKKVLKLLQFRGAMGGADLAAKVSTSCPLPAIAFFRIS